MSTAHLVNDPANVVDEALEGTALAWPHVKRLPGHRVLIRDDVDAVKETLVSVVCGGGSGHEPAHAGFIGAGMLTGVVCGSMWRWCGVCGSAYLVIIDPSFAIDKKKGRRRCLCEPAGRLRASAD